MAAGLGLLVFLALFPRIASASLQAVGDFLVVRDPVIPVDAVIAISGDGTGERVVTASSLLRQGNARWLILSGSTAGAAPGGAVAAMLRVAMRSGVPAERILIETGSASTLDNARNSARLMQARGLRTAILVSSPYHTRRAAWIFLSEFQPRGLNVRAYAAHNSFFDAREWWTRARDRGLVLGEYRKLLGFMVGAR
jgi:uncharacterized SAM-binding protein YcdF (DUF218 family)